MTKPHPVRRLLGRSPTKTPFPLRNNLLTSWDLSDSGILNNSWLHLQDPLIDWVTHEHTFRTKDMSNPPGRCILLDIPVRIS